MIPFIERIVSIIGDFMGRITAKRLAVIALFLIYMGGVVYAYTQTIPQMPLPVLALFIVVPAIICGLAIASFTWVGGGDEMLVSPKNSSTPSETTNG